MDTVAIPLEEGARTSRQDWIDLARQTLIDGGVEKIKVLTLAKALGVSRSSFYWFFKDRQDLLDRLLDHWEETNTTAIVEHAARPAETIAGAVLNVFECWIDEKLYNARLDFAIRDWARRDASVRSRLDAAEAKRVGALTGMYERHGFNARDAMIQAKTLYFMQVGYYALEVDETIEERLEYVNDYVRAFSGSRATSREMSRFTKFARQFR